MTHNDIKNTTNKLFSLYVTEDKKEIYVNELFILIYYHPRNFAIRMRDEVLNDFRATLYLKAIENIFLKYDEEKSSFFTFVCTCLKNQAKAFLRDLYVKNAIDESIFNEMANNATIKAIDENNSMFQDYGLDKNADESNCDLKYEENDMKEMLSAWLSGTETLKPKKNYRKAIFILSCKIAYILDEKMIKKIAEYIEIPENLLRYYISKLNLEHATSSNARKLLEVRTRRDKYFVRKASAEVLLSNGNLSESEKSILECSKKYSIQKYQKACKKLENEKQKISNRTIARVTGIARSMIDRILANISDILKHVPSICNK